MPISPLSASQRWRPYVTVACIVTDAERYLVVEEKINGKPIYNQPAGHLKNNETLTQAGVREALEETGWTVELKHLVGVYQWRSSEHGDSVLRFCFAARALRHDPTRKLDSDIQRALWLTRSELAAPGMRLRSPLVLTSIDDWLGGARWPLAILS